MSLEDVKTLLGINDNDRDELINLIISNVESQLKARLDAEIIPIELQYIVTEVAIVRYNRLGSEGMSTESVEGHSATYNQNDFSPYSYEIQNYLEEDDDDEYGPRRGAIRAL